MKYFLISTIVLFTYQTQSATTDYFKNTYPECEADFDAKFSKAKASNKNAEIHEFQYAEGTLKSYFFPAKNEKSKKKNLLILISGTHGIEAFAGSAVQRYLLDQNLNNVNTAILMIHGFNLYGFKNDRRVNEANIDLNRNFVLTREMFKPDDQKYALINSFLNPSNPPSTGFFSHTGFILNSIKNIVLYSMDTLRSSILKGQYTYPKGVFYGGDKTQIQSLLIQDLIIEFIKPGSFKKVMLVDLHTGYGEKAKLHLLAGKSTDQNSQNLLKVYNKDEIDFADKKNFYAVEGEMLNYFMDKIKLNVDTEVSGITFEYGTMDSQKTLGSIESLRRVVLENQNFHNSAEQAESEKIKALYREMFYPSDTSWREAVLKQTDEKLQKILVYLK